MSKPSKRALAIWKRFGGWYGAAELEKQYGVFPPSDWCELIDDTDEATLERAMLETRTKYPKWLPKFGEFETLIAKARPRTEDMPSVQEQLCDFALKHRTLTGEQLRQPWTYLYTGDRRTGAGFAITGVVIPADGDQPGYRVMVEDMQLGQLQL